MQLFLFHFLIHIPPTSTYSIGLLGVRKDWREKELWRALSPFSSVSFQCQWLGNREVTQVRKDRIRFLGHWYFLESHCLFSVFEASSGLRKVWFLVAVSTLVTQLQI